MNIHFVQVVQFKLLSKLQPSYWQLTLGLCSQHWTLTMMAELIEQRSNRLLKRWELISGNVNFLY